MSYNKCLQCHGAVDHAPGGPFCRVVTKVAKQETEITDLYRILNDKNLMIAEYEKIVDSLQATIDRLKLSQVKSGNA